MQTLLSAFSNLIATIVETNPSVAKVQFWKENEGYFSLSKFSDYSGFLVSKEGLSDLIAFISEGKRSWRLNLSIGDKQMRSHFTVGERGCGVLFIRLFGKHLYQLHILPSFSPIVVRIRNLRHPTQGEIVQKVDGVRGGLLLKKYVEKVLMV